jgi:hypothetical protein
MQYLFRLISGVSRQESAVTGAVGRMMEDQSVLCRVDFRIESFALRRDLRVGDI